MSRPAPTVSLHTLAVTAFRLRELGIAVALLVAIVFFSVRSDAFLTAGNWRNIALNVATVVVVAVGQTMVVLTRNIDLSVGSIVGLSAFISADTLAAHNGLPVVVAAAIAVAVGLGCGLFNGLLVTVGKVPAIIATLGTLYIYRGLVHQVSGGLRSSPSSSPPRSRSSPSATSSGSPPWPSSRSWSPRSGRQSSAGRTGGATSTRSAPTRRLRATPVSLWAAG